MKHLDYYIKPFVALTKAKPYADVSTQKRQIQGLSSVPQQHFKKVSEVL